jgi:hypothetical protein
MTVNHSVRRGLPIGSVQERQASLPGPLRELHRRVLGGFLTHGGPPPPGAVAGMATELDLDPHRALEALAAADLVHSDPVSGAISVAYPYSGRPTPHRVQSDEGIEVPAMCALDALGIPLMTGRDARISSTDPASGQHVTVEVQSGAWRFEPRPRWSWPTCKPTPACAGRCWVRPTPWRRPGVTSAASWTRSGVTPSMTTKTRRGERA